MKTIFEKGGEKNMATEQKIKTSSKEILDIIGGKDNIISAAHCATRLRLVLKDESRLFFKFRSISDNNW